MNSFGGPGRNAYKGIALLQKPGTHQSDPYKMEPYKTFCRGHMIPAFVDKMESPMEISQNALVRSRHLYSQLSIFEGSLADLLRFWCYPRKKMRQSRRIASFLMLLTSKIKKVSQNWFVFDGANFKNAGSLAELLSF